MAGSVATTFLNVDTATISVASLNNSALANTLLGLSTAILTSILFSSKDAKEDKLKSRCYIDCFINVLISLLRVESSSLPIKTLLSTQQPAWSSLVSPQSSHWLFISTSLLILKLTLKVCSKSWWKITPKLSLESCSPSLGALSPVLLWPVAMALVHSFWLLITPKKLAFR